MSGENCEGKNKANCGKIITAIKTTNIGINIIMVSLSA